MFDGNERALGRPFRGRRGITVLTLVLIIIAVAVAAVLLTRNLTH
jgi:hypothetical protein